MPTTLMLKINRDCGISLDELEKKWAKAKAIGGEGNWASVMGIFKKDIPEACKEKLGWKEALIKESIAFDLDGTLAKYTKWNGSDDIGEPIEPMVNKLKKFIKQGIAVKIFTARASKESNIPPIKQWLKQHIGRDDIPITNLKTHDIEKFYDDRAVTVEKNTGKVLCGE